MFIESLGNATMHNGILRIETKILGGDGKEQVVGQLVIPAQQAGRIVQQYTVILNELKKMIDEADAKKSN